MLAARREPSRQLGTSKRSSDLHHQTGPVRGVVLDRARVRASMRSCNDWRGSGTPGTRPACTTSTPWLGSASENGRSAR